MNKRKKESKKRRGIGTKCICVNVWWKHWKLPREMKRSTEIYKYECVTERKCTRITDARVWNSVREKDKENERERYGRRMLQDIRAEAGYKKQDSSRRPSGSERER